MITFRVNDREHTLDAHSLERLLDVLRERLHLTGTKEGCGEGECGACSVLLNGTLVNSCLVPIAQVSGASVTTIEGLGEPGQLSAVQASFLANGGAQCGMCTPGMILATTSLLRSTPHPDDAAIRDGLSGNLCRCTGYTRIFAAVHEAASRLHPEPAREQA